MCIYSGYQYRDCTLDRDPVLWGFSYICIYICRYTCVYIPSARAEIALSIQVTYCGGFHTYMYICECMCACISTARAEMARSIDVTYC